ncbi:MAG TPA: GAF domain-containing sensor histidine kinase [Candidatus Binatia bacterium]
MLASISQKLMRTLARPALIDELCQLAAEALESAASSMLLREPGSTTLLPVSAFGDGRRFAQLSETAPATLSATIGRLEHDDAVVVDAPDQDRTVDGEPTSWIAIAIRGIDRLAGILFVGRVGATRFSTTDRRIAEGISRMASLALENARLVEELERANRVKSDFVATMSHELRTPLHIILGYLSLLIDGDFGTVSESQREVLTLVDRNAHALLELVQDTLDLSRLERDSLPLNRREVAPAALLDSLRRDTRKLQRSSAVSVHWNAEENLPLLFTDPGKLKIALRNLVANAYKFTASGSVTISARACGEGVEFSVRDTGIGIPPESFEQIFEPFTQLGPTSTRRYGGVGMGLYIARRLTELLGGTIGVTSRRGEGSTFNIWIPSTGITASRPGRTSGPASESNQS